jgi:hypothetical protein
MTGWMISSIPFGDFSEAQSASVLIAALQPDGFLPSFSSSSSCIPAFLFGYEKEA